MKRRLFAIALLAGCVWPVLAKEAPSSALKQEMDAFTATLVEKGEVAGVVTEVGNKDKPLAVSVAGLADIDAKRKMEADSVFWIASMSKPVTGVAVMMATEQGWLSVSDPVAKYLPEFKDLKDAEGNEVTITIANCLSHTAGLQELTKEEELATSNLAQLAAVTAKKPVKFKPGTKWTYCQTGISVAARIVEVVSNETFPEFLEKRLFGPLGMKDTSFYPTEEQMQRLAVSYEKNEQGLFKTVSPYFLHGRTPTDHSRYPRASGGLFSTVSDYGKFARMILSGGELDGKRYLKQESIKEMTLSRTDGLENVGFVKGNAYGLGWIRVVNPGGVTAPLSSGSYGHGGAYGTQAWIDPEKGRYTLMMIQRANIGNGDNSDIRGAFQAAAAK